MMFHADFPLQFSHLQPQTKHNQAKAADGKQLHQNAQGIVAGLDAWSFHFLPRVAAAQFFRWGDVDVHILKKCRVMSLYEICNANIVCPKNIEMYFITI